MGHFLMLLPVIASMSSLIPAPTRAEEEFRSMEFPASLFFANKRLVNHAIKNISVPDMDICELLCYQEHDCVSFNFKTDTASATETHNCELNNSTHLEHDNELKNVALYYYRGTKNACGMKRCENGICQSGFTSKGYRCICPAGFEGLHCETDIDECSKITHVCIPGTATCTNTVGSYRCACNHGYVGDGKTTCEEVPECKNYQRLTSAERKVTYGSGHRYQCDNGLGPGWFRFERSAGTRMLTSCPPINRCGTAAPGWLNGGHPTVADGQVSRTVCFHWNGNCCNWSTSINVRNCGPFYVYYLSGTPDCYLRYCGTD